MATVTTRPTNGVSFGYVHTVTAVDVTDGYVIIDFQVDYMMAASLMITDASDVMQTSDAAKTYTANGQIRVDNGNSLYNLIAEHQIHIVANRLST